MMILMIRRMIQLFIFFVLFLTPIVTNADAESLNKTLRPKGEVINIIEQRKGLDESSGLIKEHQVLSIRILTGELKGKEVMVVAENAGSIKNMGNQNEYWTKENDIVLLQINLFDGEIVRSEVMGHTRDKSSVVLVGILLVLLIVLGRKQGLKAIVTLILTLFLVFTLMIPSIADGKDPVFVALMIGAVVTALTFVIVSGFSKKTLAAIIGTIGGLSSAAVISLVFSKMMRLTGIHGEDERILTFIPELVNLDFQGLLLAGIIIGALGAVMDVAISIASSMDEVNRLNRSMTQKQLFFSGMNVGKDIMGTMANTLILAYVGAALPIIMILYSYNNPLSELIHMEFLAVEVLRTAAGSIGLILAIPMTALVASKLLNR